MYVYNFTNSADWCRERRGRRMGGRTRSPNPLSQLRMPGTVSDIINSQESCHTGRITVCIRDRQSLVLSKKKGNLLVYNPQP